MEELKKIQGKPSRKMNKKTEIANTEEMIRKLKNFPKRANVHLIGIPERENKENKGERIRKEIISENFLLHLKRSTPL